MDSATLSQIKELGVPAFSVLMLVLTAVFLIRNTIQERQKAQSVADESRLRIDKVIDETQDRYDALQKSFTQQLINEQVDSKKRETDLLKQLTETNQRVVELQLDLGQVRLDYKNTLIAVDALTRERDKKSADYDDELKSRKSLESRVSALESDLEKSRKERRVLSEQYSQLKKEHDALVAERNKLVSDIAQLKRQTQTIPKIE